MKKLVKCYKRLLNSNLSQFSPKIVLFGSFHTVRTTRKLCLSVQHLMDLATQGTASGSDSSGDWLLFSWMFILVQDHTEHVLKGSKCLHLHSWKLDYLIPLSMKINQWELSCCRYCTVHLVRCITKSGFSEYWNV